MPTICFLERLVETNDIGIDPLDLDARILVADLWVVEAAELLLCFLPFSLELHHPLRPLALERATFLKKCSEF